MKDALALVAKAAMLHDVGKICLRAKGLGNNYAALGEDFLKDFMGNSDEDQQLLRCVRYHYADDLETANLEPNDLAYIVSEANVIASGKDDIVKEAYGEGASCFNSVLNLENIFNLFDGDGENSYFSLQELSAAKTANFPKSDQQVATRENYSSILDVLKENFQKCKLADMHPNKLLRVLEDAVLYVPSGTSTNKNEACDISLYDHIKIASAVAASMLRYFCNNSIADYQDFCQKNAKENRGKNTMLFVSGDFSGIQSFIYRVQTKGAMRMLRGRSFYLDIVLENLVDEILEELSLSRANLIYCGGGHFYFLADNSDQTKELLAEAFRQVNYKLAEMFSGSLYLASAWEEICAYDLMVRKTEKNIFQRVGEKLSKAKLQRYDKDTLFELFDPKSPLNLTRKDSRECGLCHRSVNKLGPYLAHDNYGEYDSLEVCDICNGLYKLGQDILDDHKSLFAVVDGDAAVPEYSVEIPARFGKRYLAAVKEQKLDSLRKNGSLIRIYSKNCSIPSEELAARLWIGDFAAEEGGKVLDLKDLAEKSGGDKSEKGIERLGVLRADVDNLGAAFIAGLRKLKEKENPDRYATLTRYSALSRQLSMFFKKIIVDVCNKQLPKGQEPFYMFRNKGTAERLVHIVYSGGDDIFVAGAWDDLLEFAVDLHKAFKSYTNGKLSFSGGLGLYTSTYPIRLMADITGQLEDAAKKQDGKDSIALFGESTEYRYTKKKDAVEKEETPVFKWDDFEGKVCHEKLRFLLDHFAMDGLTEDTGKNLKVGKSLLYRLLVLLTASRKESFNLARFAYTLARLEPGKRDEARKGCYKEVREKLFCWSREENSRKELVVAILLIIYCLRDKQEA